MPVAHFQMPDGTMLEQAKLLLSDEEVFGPYADLARSPMEHAPPDGSFVLVAAIVCAAAAACATYVIAGIKNRINIAAKVRGINWMPVRIFIAIITASLVLLAFAGKNVSIIINGAPTHTYISVPYWTSETVVLKRFEKDQANGISGEVKIESSVSLKYFIDGALQKTGFGFGDLIILMIAFFICLVIWAFFGLTISLAFFCVFLAMLAYLTYPMTRAQCMKSAVSKESGEAIRTTKRVCEEIFD